MPFTFTQNEIFTRLRKQKILLSTAMAIVTILLLILVIGSSDSKTSPSQSALYQKKDYNLDLKLVHIVSKMP